MTGSLFHNPTAFEAGLQDAFTARSSTNEAQAAAFDRFARMRFPNRRVEGWKWSDFNAALRKLDPAKEESVSAVIAPSAFAALDPLEFRIVAGKIELPQEEEPEGLRYGIMDAVATIPELEVHPIASLNVAMTRKALGIEAGEGVQFERPIVIRHINTGAGFSFAQTMMRISPKAKVQIIETYEGDGAGFYSHLFHMVVRDAASFSRIVLDETGANSVTHAICAAKIEAEARFEQTSLSTGAQLSRHETHAHFWAPASSAVINSAALVGDNRHADFTSEVLHVAGDCTARQLHKGVARDHGRAVFQGKFRVKRDAQKTDSQMTANALLLSETAEANHKPELEIYADDVECAHGSTAGALDEDALFYLRQRGLSESAARALLIKAFVSDVIDGVAHEQIREVLAARVENWQEAS